MTGGTAKSSTMRRRVRGKIASEVRTLFDLVPFEKRFLSFPTGQGIVLAQQRPLQFPSEGFEVLRQTGEQLALLRIRRQVADHFAFRGLHLKSFQIPLDIFHWRHLGGCKPDDDNHLYMREAVSVGSIF